MKTLDTSNNLSPINLLDIREGFLGKSFSELILFHIDRTTYRQRIV